MATVTLRGNPVETSGELPAVGTSAPAYSLAAQDLSEITNETLAGKRIIMNIFPSIDTAICSTSVRRFNERAAGLDNTVVLCVSEDLPFAAKRFCGAEGIENVTTGSGFRGDFARTFGVRIQTGTMTGLMARSVVVIDEHGKIAHTELVPEIAQEPDYDAAIAALG